MFLKKRKLKDNVVNHPLFDAFIQKIVKENIEHQKNPPDYSYLQKITIEEINELGKMVARN